MRMWGCCVTNESPATVHTGAGYCSTAMVVQPPSQSAADGGPGPGASPAGLAGGAAADPKKAGPAKPGKPAHADSSKAAATSRGRPGTSQRM